MDADGSLRAGGCIASERFGIDLTVPLITPKTLMHIFF